MTQPLFRLAMILLLSASLLPAQAGKAAAGPKSSALEGSAAGIKWTATSRWTSEAPRPMRAATYRIPAAAGDREGGECAVFFFGSGEGGAPDANVKRWVGQFQQPDGKPVADVKSLHQQINGLKVLTVDVSGTYLAVGGPMSPVKSARPGYRLLGAIVEAPQGNVFFKLTGPARTAAASEKEFQALLKSLRKG